MDTRSTTRHTRAAHLLAIAASVLTLAGCTHQYTPEPAPMVTSRRAENLRNVASRHMSCPMNLVDIEPLTPQVWQARGCGQTAEFAIVQRGPVARWDRLQPVQVRASNALACPIERMVIAAPTGTAREVSGCGRNATYQLACTDRECRWEITDYSGDWARRGGVTVTPPGRQPPPPAPGSPVVVVPDYDRGGAIDPRVEGTIRRAIESQRASILSCMPSARGVVVSASWGPDGLVRISLEPPWSGTPTERCVQRSIGQFQVTTGEPGALRQLVQ